MSNKKKKKTRKPQNPPLSLLDTGIYIFLIFLSIPAVFLSFLCVRSIQEFVGFRDHSVIACRSSASVLWILPFCLFIAVSFGAFFSWCLAERKPVFGNKRVKYGDTPWASDCFPLFDPRRKNVYVKPSKKRFRRKALRLWCAALLVVISLTPLSLFGRYSLHGDHSLVSYNMFNQKSDNVYTAEDFSHITIAASTYRTGTNYLARLLSEAFTVNVTVRITVKMTDGKSFSFSFGEFLHSEHKVETLQAMLAIKSLLPSQSVSVVGTTRIDDMIDDWNLNDTEAQLLRSLFGT